MYKTAYSKFLAQTIKIELLKTMGGSRVVSSWPSDVNFRAYTKSEVEALSVKELTSPNLFYADSASENSPEIGGLHDPALGPLERYERCVTCGQKEQFCPG